MFKALGNQLNIFWSQTCFSVVGIPASVSQSPIRLSIRMLNHYMFPRWRGRIILTRDPDGEERCVACNLMCCRLSCGLYMLYKKLKMKTGRWYPEFFRINFSRCIMCGFCEEACPTHAIQLTPDFEMAEYVRQDMVWEKEHMLIDGTGKYHDYNFYKVAGKAIGGKG